MGLESRAEGPVHREGRPYARRMHRVVVVGAGFAGLEAVKVLARAGITVTLVDRRNYSTFQPLLYQIATAGLDPGDVAHAIRRIVRDHPTIAVLQAAVETVDLDACEVVLADGDRLGYDAVVLAAGASTHFFGVPGASEHAFPLYTLTDAMRLRAHVLSCFEHAEDDPRLVDEGILRFVLVGGGATGVEMAGALAELFAKVMARDFRRIDPTRAEILVVEALDTLLSAFSPAARRHALETLQDRGIAVRLGETVSSIAPDTVTLRSGETIATRTAVWTAGVQAASLSEQLGVERAKGGRIVVDRDLSLPSHPNAFVVGDFAAAPGRAGAVLPQLAQPAIQGGRHAARQIVRRLEGRSTRPFRYVDHGNMATIGRRAAVADLPLGIRLRGTVAWLAWLFLHLLYLIGFRRRVQVLTAWAWNYLAWDWGPRLITPVEREQE